MIEEGLYDSEPQYVRATLYEDIYKKYPFAGIDFHDALIDYPKFIQWLKDSGYSMHHTKSALYCKDNEERSTIYYVNSTLSAMVMVKRNYNDPTKTPRDITSVSDLGETNENPNRIDWISFYGQTEQDVSNFKDTLAKFKIEEDCKNKLYMLKINEYNALDLEAFPTDCGNMSLELNYGKSFAPVHERIVDSLKNKKSGLYIFHGPPGTGKTSFIKYLTNEIETKKFIFVPNLPMNEKWDDEKLFAKYELTANEIEFISQLIRPIKSNENDL